MSRPALYRPKGSLASERYELELTQQQAGWDWCSLRILRLAPGGGAELESGQEELALLPLEGSCEVRVGAQAHELHGRASVFDGPSDFAYLPRGARFQVASERGGRFALAGARAERELPFRYSPASAVSVELRGAGNCSRQVHNFCTADAFEADRLIACEVITPSGNWSSYPPHKHDEQRPGESVLEEIYYFELAGVGPAYLRVYGSEERPFEELAEVSSGDLVLVPHGWHGPSMAPPGYDLYYLNVMGGPGERAWQVCFDPAHDWVRGTWAGQPVDPRLPFDRTR